MFEQPGVKNIRERKAANEARRYLIKYTLPPKIEQAIRELRIPNPA